MGFDVARSTIQGNAKASVRGTSDEEIPRFPFILIANLGMKGWLGKEFLWIIEKQKKLRKEWGNKPCSHPNFEVETHLDSGYAAVKTGDYVCTCCGQDFTKEEKDRIIAKRNKD